MNKQSTDEPIKITATFDSVVEVIGHLENLGFLLALIEEKHVDRFGAAQLATQINTTGHLIQVLTNGVMWGLDEIGMEFTKAEVNFEHIFEMYQKAQDYLNPESVGDRSVALIFIRDMIQRKYPNIQQVYRENQAKINPADNPNPDNQEVKIDA